MALVEISGLTIGFGAEATSPPVVDGVNLTIGKGEIVALVGESGSGKSMTALSIVGLLPEGGKVRAGRILFGGEDLLKLGEADLRSVRGARIGMIFQEPMTSLNPVLTIGEQLVEALIVHEKLSKAEGRKRAIAMLERTGIDNAARRLRQYPHEFSGGMRQRVMIAMMMALKPALLIADEPTTALDVTIQAQILDLLREMVGDRDTSLLLITHDMGVVAEMADRVLVMRDGKVVEEGACEAIFATPQADYTRKLLAAVPTLDDPPREATATSFGAEVLRLETVSRSFGGGLFSAKAPLKAVDGVTLTVREGETLALVGESGSGKSTLGRLAMRLERPDEGRVVVAGEDITHLSGRGLRRVRRAIQMIFQDPYASLDPRFSIGRTIGEPMIIEGGSDRSEVRERVGALLERTGLSAAMAGRMPHELSGGQRQRVAIARALAVGPRIIVADEPTSALDVSVQAKILDLMIALQEAEALAYLFITHDLAVVRRIAHRVAVMRKGRIVELGAAADVLERPVHPLYAFADRRGPGPGSGAAPGAPSQAAGGRAADPRDGRAMVRRRRRALDSRVTIGIAAHGPAAGRATLSSLRSVERLATGAIGGFVSMAALGADGQIHRAEIQDGGVTALLDEGRVRRAVLEAPSVVLMSSGPNRPEPLSQFTPAAVGVGLVTGHRFPNNRGADGRSLGEAVLAAMAAGATTREAVESVASANPGADAGLIALSADGRVFAADTAFIARFGDRGGITRESADGTAGVAILHNGIEPHESLASLLAEMIVKAMTSAAPLAGTLELCAGTPIAFGGKVGLVLSDTNTIKAVRLIGNGDATGRWSCGTGYRAPVWRSGDEIGFCLDEPFLVTEGERIVSVNGRSQAPIRWSAPLDESRGP